MVMNYRWQYTKTQRDIKTWFDAVDLDGDVRFGEKGPTEERQPLVEDGDNSGPSSMTEKILDGI
jgi:hypothetical protein